MIPAGTGQILWVPVRVWTARYCWRALLVPATPPVPCPRFALVMRHLQKTGRSVNTAVNSYNALLGSLESRVLPQLRKLEES